MALIDHTKRSQTSSNLDNVTMLMDRTNPENTEGPSTTTYVKGSSGDWNGEVEGMKAPRKGIEMTQDIKWVVHAR